MQVLNLEIKNISDKKEVKSIIREFNKFYKDVDRVVFKFDDNKMIADLVYIFNRLNCSLKEFENKVIIEDTSKEEVSLLAFNIFHEKKRRNKVFWIKFSLILILISGAIFGAYRLGNFLYNDYYLPYIKVKTIENKISFLIEKHELYNSIIKDYENYYSYRSLQDQEAKVEVRKNIKKLSFQIYRCSLMFDIPENLLIALIKTESDFRKYDVSRVGAMGYGQIYLKVWGEIVNADKIFDEEENIYWSTYILKYYLRKNNNDVYKALFCYNGGKFKTVENKKVLSTEESFMHLKKIFNIMNDLTYYDTSMKRKYF